MCVELVKDFQRDPNNRYLKKRMSPSGLMRHREIRVPVSANIMKSSIIGNGWPIPACPFRKQKRIIGI